MHIVDTCALSNFLHAEKLDLLIAFFSEGMAVSAEVAQEIASGSGRFPSFKAFSSAVNENKIAVLRLEELDDLKAFFDRKRKMGKGEMSCFLLAKRKGLTLVTDDRFARKTALNAVPPVEVLSSDEILLHAVRQGIITKDEALEIASFWGSNPYCLAMSPDTIAELQNL